MKKVSTILSCAMLAGLAVSAMGQDTDTTAVKIAAMSEKLTNVSGKVNGIEEDFLATKATVDKLAKIKVSGYVQAQLQYAETLGVLAPNVQSRAMIKRGRLKTTYDNGLGKYVLEIDVTQDGVAMKDAYASFTEPWLKSISLTFGSQDRPFGYEIGYSSSMLESPERSKMIGVLFPKEKDLGAVLEIAPDESMGMLSYLNVKAGAFNGQTNVLNENDDNKDAIGRVGLKIPLTDLNMEVDGGFSAYIGKDENFSPFSYKMVDKIWTKSTGGDTLKSFERQYTGFDLQYFCDIPVVGGICLKGEYVSGKHPSVLNKSDIYAGVGALQNRNVRGFFVQAVQNINPINAQLVLKYDLFDPNTDVSGKDLSDTAVGTTKLTGLTKADLAVSTFGLGVVYYIPWDSNVRLMAYYEMPTLELPSKQGLKASSDFTKLNNKDPKDNLLTLRVQYKF